MKILNVMKLVVYIRWFVNLQENKEDRMAAATQ